VSAAETRGTAGSAAVAPSAPGGPDLAAALLDQVAEAILVIEPDGTLRYASDAAHRLFGWPAAEWIGRDVIELVHPDDRAGAIDGIAVTVRDEGRVSTRELRARTADGGSLWVEALATSRVHDPAIHGLVVTLRDVTDRRAERAALAEAEQRFRLAFDQAPIGMALVSPDGRFLRVNDAVCDIVGRSADELLHTTFQEITHPDDLDIDLDFVDQVLEGSLESYAIEKRYFHGSGEVVWALLHVSLVRDADGTPQYFISQIQDVTDRKHAEQDLVRASRQDALTGLANRRSIEEHLEQAVAGGDEVVVLFLDVDHLKVVNDRLGHLAGDQLLRLVGRRIEASLKGRGLVARWGGDEFVALLDHEPDVDDLRTAIERPVRVGGFILRPQVSLGMARGTGTTHPVGLIVARADADMYEDKRRRAEPRPGPPVGLGPC
jgi:PAS domain S-box-containing protein/diguanylate cyclase (GGDEF)-like protein